MKKIKAIISGILLAVLVAVCLASLPALRLEAKAATVLSGSCGDNVTWTLDDAGTLTISGYGAIKDSSTTPWYGQHEAIKSVVIQEGVTAIGESAFSGCTALESVSIPASVKSIGKHAFQGCAALASVVIPEGVTSIGYSAFYGCAALTHVTVPNSVNDIGSYAFMQCPNLQYNTYDNAQYLGNSENPYRVLADTVSDAITSCTIHPKAKLIYPDAFGYCTKLTSITVPENIEVIGRNAFIGCSSLESITLPFIGDSRKTSLDTYQYTLGYIFGNSSYTGCIPTVQEQLPYSTTYYIPASLKSVTVTGGNILYGAFSGCSHLTSVTLPENLSAIEKSAFRGCSGLTEITIPDSVERIGDTAFYYCTKLKNITFEGSAPSFGDNSFQGVTATVYYSPDDSWTEAVMQDYGGDITWVAQYKESQGLRYMLSADHSYYVVIGIGTCTDTQLVIPSVYEGLPVKEIYFIAFAENQNLTSVIIPEGMTRIGEGAFAGCSNLTSVTIPGSVTVIDESAFSQCSGLTSLTIPEGVGVIGESAFYGCRNLTSVTVPKSVTAMGQKVFSRCSGLTELQVAAGNSVYHSAGNCIIETASKTLIQGCKTSQIPTDGSVTAIGDKAFSGCTGLTGITIPSGVLSIGSYAFDGCSGLTSVTIPNSVQSIGGGAFSCCYGLRSVALPEGLKSIEAALFLTCRNLTSVTIPDGVITIANQPFSGCSGLTEITIPGSVQSIGTHAFYNCTGLTDIYFDGSAPTMEGDKLFSKVTATAHYYPDDTWTEAVMQNYGGDITWTPMSSDVKLSLTSFGAAADPVTAVFTPSGETEAAYTLTTADSPANFGVWTLSGVKPGTYTVTLWKKNHVKRSYTLTVGDAEASLEAQLWLLGDVNGDGMVNFSDYSKVLSQAKNPTAGILEGYALACADVTADGMVNFSDYAKVLSQAKGNSVLW